MDAHPSAPTMARGWNINSSRPQVAHFASAFDMKSSMIDAPRSHLNVGLASSPSLTPNLGDYLANHGHRLIGASTFSQSPMISLRTTEPNYSIKEFASRNEEFVSLFDQGRSTRQGDEDLAGAGSHPGMSLSTPIADARLQDVVNVSMACLPQYSVRLLPILTAQKNMITLDNVEVKCEDERHNNDDDDNEEDEDEDEDGDDDEGIAWPSQTPTSGSGSMHEKGVIVMRQGASTRGSSPIACQDCGNQAKRDCVHMRCRTCCKNRGLDCVTHVKSTWIPAFKRRQRQQLFSNNDDKPIKLLRSKPPRTVHPNLEQAASEATHGANSHTSASTGTPPPCSDLNWLQDEGKLKRALPAEARENAVFKCVKVTGVNDGHEEYAYQTVVKIGGHIYKGMLYDQGLDKGLVSASSIGELRLGGRSVAPSSSIDLTGNLYGTSESVFLGGNHATH